MPNLISPPQPANNKITVFTERCGARATLWAAGYLSLHDAVDKLQHDAVRDGLVGEIGQNAVQMIMAQAFEQRRIRL